MSVREPSADDAGGDRWRGLCLGSLAALLTATPLLPTEAVNLGGAALALVVLWIVLLLVWGISSVVTGRLEFRGGIVLWALVLFLLWHSLSAAVMSDAGNPRATINMAWQWLSFGLAFFLTRQLVRTSAEQRAIVSLMVGVAVGLSVLGYYQYFYELPLNRAEFYKDPEKVLRDAGIVAPPGTPQRANFENRLNSTEPFATFALTNSLAAFLATWLTVVLGVGMANWIQGTTTRRTRIAAVLTAAVIAGCWMLTKSRTAWIATLAGVLLLAVYGRRTGWRPDWRLALGAATAAVVLPFIGFVVGGLDSFVLLEASKAMLYRVQYWRATAQMIAHHPLFGCGPGNFQQYYTAYKLPEASESVAEPHNFLLEIWATAGTPAIVLFATFFGCLAWQMWQWQKRQAGEGEAKLATETTRSSRTATTHHPKQSETLGEIGSAYSIYVGGLAGAVFAYVSCEYLEGYSLSLGLLLFGLPMGAATIGLWHAWVLEGRWPLAIPAIAIAVFLINLLAAGGIGFASVSQTLWVLCALLLNRVEGPQVFRPLSRGVGLAIAAASLLAAIAFAQTAYLPRLVSESFIAEAQTSLEQRRPDNALASYRKAAEADAFSWQPWDRLADLAHAGWLATGDERYYEQFVEASNNSLRLNPRSHIAHSQTGHRWLAAYRRFGKREYLEHAIGAYRVAIRVFPNYNLGHAQLAWTLHLAGDEEAAAEHAAKSLRLDEVHPHSEQKLARQKIYDAAPEVENQRPPPGAMNAEQAMLALRKSQGG